MKRLLITLLFISLTILLFFCDSSTDPIENPPGRRDYTWEVDTINVPFMSFTSIWGNSPENVWIVGPGGGLDKTIFHYDGTSWKTDGISRNVSPFAIWGFTNTDVWLSGSGGEIWHFDGSDWIENKRIIDSTLKHIEFQGIWGNSPSNIFSIGVAGNDKLNSPIIAHYNGEFWKMDSYTNLLNYSFIRIRGNDKTEDYFIYALKEDSNGGDIKTIFSYTLDGKLKIIYEGQEWAFIQKIKGNVYLMVDKTISTYVNNKFIQFLKIKLPNFGWQIFGRNRNDIFLRMFDGIAHYNGTDIKYIYHFNSNISITDGMVFDNEVFFLAIDRKNSNDYIIHGRLNGG